MLVRQNSIILTDLSQRLNKVITMILPSMARDLRKPADDWVARLTVKASKYSLCEVVLCCKVSLFEKHL